jgi:hypothetical protein
MCSKEVACKGIFIFSSNAGNKCRGLLEIGTADGKVSTANDMSYTKIAVIATETTATTTTITTATATTTTITSSTTTATTVAIDKSFQKLLWTEETSTRKKMKFQLENVSTFFCGFDYERDINFLELDVETSVCSINAAETKPPLDTPQNRAKVTAEVDSDSFSICTTVDNDRLPIALFDPKIKFGPFSLPAFPKVTAENVDDSFWGIGRVQYCVDETSTHIRGSWMGEDMRMSIYMGYDKSDGLTFKATVPRGIPCVDAESVSCSRTPETRTLADFLFGAKLPRFSGTIAMGLKAIGLGFLEDIASKIPLLNTPDKGGLIEVLVRPKFNLTESGSNDVAEAGLGRVTFRVGGDGKLGGTYLVNLLVYSSTSGQFTGEDGEQWTFALAAVKAPDSKPLSFVDTMVSEEDNETTVRAGMLDGIVDAIPFLDRRTARNIFEFLALSEIGIRITTGSNSQPIPQDALAQGASLCYTDRDSGRFCSKHLEPFGVDLELGARIVASMRKKQLPPRGDGHCHIVCQIMHTILPHDEAFMELEGTFELTPVTKVQLGLAMEVNWEIIKDTFIINELNLFIGGESTSPPQFNLGFDIRAILKTESSDLEFVGELSYEAPATFSLSMSMKGMYHNVIGWKYLHVGNMHLTGALTPVPPHIANVGFGGDICVGTAERCKKCVGAIVSPGKLGVGTECIASPIAPASNTGSATNVGNCDRTIYARAAFMLSPKKLDENYFYLEIRSDLTLKALFDALEIDHSLIPSFVTDTGLVKPPGSDAIWFSFAFKKHTLTNVCPPIIIPNGIVLRAGLNLFNVFESSLELELQYASGTAWPPNGAPDRIHIDYQQSPIEFKWKEKTVLALTSAEDHNEGPRFYVDYIKGNVPDIEITARIVVLGLQAQASVKFSNKGFNVVVEGGILGSALKATLTVSGEFPQGMIGTVRHHTLDGVQLRAKARLDTAIFRRIIEGLQTAITWVRDKAMERIEGAQAAFGAASDKLAEWQRDLESKKITRDDKARIKKEAESKFDSARAKLASAKLPFYDAQDKLDEARYTVNSLCRIQECNWYHAKCIISNLGCLLLQNLATAALYVAELALKVPLAALSAAEYAVDAAQGLYNGAVEALSIINGVIEIAQGTLYVLEKAADGAVFALEQVKRAVKYGLDLALKVLDWIPTLDSIEFELGLGDETSIRFQVSITIFGKPKTLELNLAFGAISNFAGAIKDMIFDALGFSRRRSRSVGRLDFDDSTGRFARGEAGITLCGTCNAIAIKSIGQWLSWAKTRQQRLHNVQNDIALLQREEIKTNQATTSYKMPSRAELIARVGKVNGNLVADQVELITPAELEAQIQADPTVAHARKAMHERIEELIEMAEAEKSGWWNAWVAANITLPAEQPNVGEECPLLACSEGNTMDCLLASAEVVKLWAVEVDDVASICEQDPPFDLKDLPNATSSPTWAGLGAGCSDSNRALSRIAAASTPTISTVMETANTFVGTNLDETGSLDHRFHQEVSDLLSAIAKLSNAPGMCSFPASDLLPPSAKPGAATTLLDILEATINRN